MLNLEQEINFGVNCLYFHHYSTTSCISNTKYEEKALTFLRGVCIITWYSALVRLVSCVSSDVLLEMGELGELPLTDLTPVGLDTQVDSHVLGEVGAVGEGLAAVAALVRLGFPHVHLGVELEICLGAKSLE